MTLCLAKYQPNVNDGVYVWLLKDLYMDYQVYSGRELVKAWGANLIPVATGLGGGVVGGSAGPVGFLLLVLLERHLGIIIRIESNLI